MTFIADRDDEQMARPPASAILCGLMLLAVALRAWAALTPGFLHPDAVYQYLEPAYRLLGGDGVITWEWRVGIRSWMLPALLAGPLWIGETLAPDGPLPMILPRLATATASLGTVWAAWTIGRRHSLLTGALAGFVAATWFEIVFFAAETLAEPLATAAIIPAAALLTQPRVTNGRIVLAGALLGFAILARPHYTPAAAALVIVSWWCDLAPPRLHARRWAALIGGALLVAGVSAAIDARQGLTPFAWMMENVQQNVVKDVSSRYGTLPFLSYVAWFMAIWSWWLVPAIIGIRFGWRQCPGLLAVAIVTLLLHSLIPHKEYRFVFLAFTALTLLAALGWGEMLAIARRRAPMLRWWLAVGVFALWAGASLSLAQGSFAPNNAPVHAEGWKTFAALRRDPSVCGVALVRPASFADVPGAVGLRRTTPLQMFWSGDPAAGHATPWQTAMRWHPTFNRIVTASKGPTPLPPGYHVMQCEWGRQGRMCILARPGGCTAAATSPFRINPVMARTGF
jgi:hypothetical protein